MNKSYAYNVSLVWIFRYGSLRNEDVLKSQGARKDKMFNFLSMIPLSVSTIDCSEFCKVYDTSACALENVTKTEPIKAIGIGQG
jgi:hypothetical protein